MTQIDLVDRRLLRRYPIRPAYVTRALLSLTRHYFAKEEYLVTERFRKRHNHSVTPAAEDNIVIESPMAWPVEFADKRPAIFIRRLNWVLRRIGLGDGRWGGNPTVVEGNTFSWAWRGTHGFFLIAREGGELEFLVEEMINLLVRFTPIIRTLFGFCQFQMTSVGRIEAYTVATDYFQVPIIVQYDWVETWHLSPGLETVITIVENALDELTKELAQ